MTLPFSFSSSLSLSSNDWNRLSLEFAIPFLTLGVFCAILSLVSLIQTIRFWHASGPTFTFGVQKTFAMVLFFASLLRTVFFIMSPLTTTGRAFFEEDRSNRRSFPAFAVMADSGELLFFFSLSLLGLFWAEVCYSSQGRKRVFDRRVRPLFFTFLIAFGCLGQIILWLIEFLTDSNTTTAISEFCDNILFIFLYIAIVFVTVYFGISVFRKVRKNPTRSAGRTKKLQEIIIVTLSCCLFLLFHTATSLVNIIPHGPDLHHTNYIVLSIYVVLFELLPASILLYVLRYRQSSSADSASSQQQLTSSQQQLQGMNSSLYIPPISSSTYSPQRPLLSK